MNKVYGITISKKQQKNKQKTKQKTIVFLRTFGESIVQLTAMNPVNMPGMEVSRVSATIIGPTQVQWYNFNMQW